MEGGVSNAHLVPTSTFTLCCGGGSSPATGLTFGAGYRMYVALPDMTLMPVPFAVPRLWVCDSAVCVLAGRGEWRD